MNKILIFLIKIYKKLFSSLLRLVFGKGCRFYPTCSAYSKEALERYGALKGTVFTIKRLSRCHPFSKAYYFDPVPERRGRDSFV